MKQTWEVSLVSQLIDDVIQILTLIKQSGKDDNIMVWADNIYNSKAGRKQMLIRNGNTPVAVLETWGFENLEQFKKHVDKVVETYAFVMETVRKKEPIKKYNPTTVPKFVHKMNDDETAVTLKYDGSVFAQLKLEGIPNMDLALKYIYKVFQSFKRYSNVCVDI